MVLEEENERGVEVCLEAEGEGDRERKGGIKGLHLREKHTETLLLCKRNRDRRYYKT